MKRLLFIMMVLLVGIISFPVSSQAIKTDKNKAEIHKYIKMGKTYQGDNFFRLPVIKKALIGRPSDDNWGLIKGPLIKAAIIARACPGLSHKTIEEMLGKSEHNITIFFSAYHGYGEFPKRIEVSLIQDNRDIYPKIVRDSRVKLKRRINKEFDFSLEDIDPSAKTTIIVTVNSERVIKQKFDFSQIK